MSDDKLGDRYMKAISDNTRALVAHLVDYHVDRESGRVDPAGQGGANCGPTTL
jgi:hypothetical protein